MNDLSPNFFVSCIAFLCVFFSGCNRSHGPGQQPPRLERTSVAQTYNRPAWITKAEHLQAIALRTSTSSPSGPRFTRIDGASIGVEFQNQLKRKNIKNYLLSGAGLTVGDIDANGLPDLFLVSQDGPNKLFLQTAPWKFEDVTTAYGMKDQERWGSGAAFADIDNDGDLDLYLCNKAAHDVIYFNDGKGSFDANELTEGDATLRAPTMAAFSDFDRDGDLDFYRTETRLLSIKEMFNFQIDLIKNDSGEIVPAPRYAKDVQSIGGGYAEVGTYDHLFLNEGSPQPGDIALRDVTRKAGIGIAREHGLAAVWWDYNNDNAPDLYVSNDFHTPDHFYKNNRDGSFTEMTGEALPYTSWNSMGSDFADINNDGWFDYLSTDMSATTHYKQKTMMGAMSNTAWFLDNLEPRQYMRNAMQVNTGTGDFIDVAFHAGLDSTDWTWAGIFGDLDNDGLEDAYFTNGIERNVQDSDLSKRMDAVKEKGGNWNEIQEILLASPRFTERNLAFRNQGNLKFENVSNAWGLSELSVSHGAVLADLDRDGDLDIVVNNMNEPVGIYRNDNPLNQAILVSLRGTHSNHFGLGARVELEIGDGQKLTRLMTSSRGYMSGVEPVLHFGLGETTEVKSLQILWPSGKVQSFRNLDAGFHYQVTEANASTPLAPLAPLTPLAPSESTQPLFVNSDDLLGIRFKHQENEYDDFADQPLLPNRLSRVGPALAVGDATGDGRQDVFFGAAAGHTSVIYTQNKGGFEITEQPLGERDSAYEDVAATWFDSDQDGDLDLYVVSGGASENDQDEHYQDRLYLNDGNGKLTPAAADVLPDLKESGSCVAASDFDGDGDVDLFIGARHVPKRYPTSPESSLLINDGGRFSRAKSPANSLGMVTGATWADMDGDQRPDLIVATEWGPVRVLKNTEDGLKEVTEQAGLHALTGWWTCVTAGDVDMDGDVDLIAGNFGSNTKYHVDAEHPGTLFASDFGNQGMLQLVEAKHGEGRLLPVRGRSCSTTAMPHLSKLAPTYKDFAVMSLEELYTPESLGEAIRLEATTLKSMLFRNDGNGHFTAEALPVLAQLAPVMDVAIGDFDQDGILDIALGQNFNDAQRETGRMNAGLGVVLKGNRDGSFEQLWPLESGFHKRTNLRRLRAVDLNQDGVLDLVSANNGESPTIHLGTTGAK